MFECDITDDPLYAVLDMLIRASSLVDAGKRDSSVTVERDDDDAVRAWERKGRGLTTSGSSSSRGALSCRRISNTGSSAAIVLELRPIFPGSSSSQRPPDRPHGCRRTPACLASRQSYANTRPPSLDMLPLRLRPPTCVRLSILTCLLLMCSTRVRLSIASKTLHSHPSTRPSRTATDGPSPSLSDPQCNANPRAASLPRYMSLPSHPALLGVLPQY